MNESTSQPINQLTRLLHPRAPGRRGCGAPRRRAADAERHASRLALRTMEAECASRRGQRARGDDLAARGSPPTAYLAERRSLSYSTRGVAQQSGCRPDALHSAR
eukprot:scaffold4857_cov403-Prasinococcus_capsulatus_cf.AAC.2